MAINLEVILLCGDTNRAKAYIYALRHVSNIMVKAIYYGVEKEQEKLSSKHINVDTATKKYLESLNIHVPDFNLSIRDYLDASGIEFHSIKEQDVNSSEIIDVIRQFPAKYVIFAGYGGQILSNEHFLNSKKYIHCHPGWLPEERGSTTLYYSILRKRPLSVTSFLMTPEIDKGSILMRSTYPIPKEKVNIDMFVDNLLRADTLRKTLLNIGHGKSSFIATDNEEEQEFYVIHPLLKHIAIMSLDSPDKSNVYTN